MDVLRGHFRPEFLNRIDEIIVFHPLGRRSATSSACSSIVAQRRQSGVTLTRSDADRPFRGRRLQARVRCA